MTLTIKLDGNWNSFQVANSAPPLSVTDSAIVPSARIMLSGTVTTTKVCLWFYVRAIAGKRVCIILAEGAVALSVTLSGGALFC